MHVLEFTVNNKPVRTSREPEYLNFGRIRESLRIGNGGEFEGQFRVRVRGQYQFRHPQTHSRHSAIHIHVNTHRPAAGGEGVYHAEADLW